MVANGRLTATERLHYDMPVVTTAVAVELAVQEVPNVGVGVEAIDRFLRLVDGCGSGVGPNGTISDVRTTNSCSGGSDHLVYVCLKSPKKRDKQ